MVPAPMPDRYGGGGGRGGSGDGSEGGLGGSNGGAGGRAGGEGGLGGRSKGSGAQVGVSLQLALQAVGTSTGMYGLLVCVQNPFDASQWQLTQ